MCRMPGGCFLLPWCLSVRSRAATHVSHMCTCSTIFFYGRILNHPLFHLPPLSPLFHRPSSQLQRRVRRVPCWAVRPLVRQPYELLGVQHRSLRGHRDAAGVVRGSDVRAGRKGDQGGSDDAHGGLHQVPRRHLPDARRTPQRMSAVRPRQARKHTAGCLLLYGARVRGGQEPGTARPAPRRVLL